jgi:hypothetical protein
MRFFPWNSGYTFTDADAAAYAAAVEAADELPLEDVVKAALDALYLGFKADGEWSAFQQLRIYAGPRTLAGCAVPAKGVAPTLVNFVSGDLTRNSGLKGGNSSKYVIQNNSALTQNSAQVWVWATEVGPNGATRHIFGNSISDSGGTGIRARNGKSVRLNTAGSGSAIYTNTATEGLIGVNRAISSSIVYRNGGASETLSSTSGTPSSDSIYTFCTNNGVSAARFIANRHAVECIGTGWTNPANIEARITTYLAAISGI